MNSDKPDRPVCLLVAEHGGSGLVSYDSSHWKEYAGKDNAARPTDAVHQCLVAPNASYMTNSRIIHIPLASLSPTRAVM